MGEIVEIFDQGMGILFSDPDPDKARSFFQGKSRVKANKVMDLKTAVETFVHDGDYLPLIDYLTTQMKKLDVNVVMKKATPQDILEGGYDAAIVACGATPMVPDVPGIDSERVVNAIEVLGGRAETGQRIAVIGAGVVGVEVGLFLAEKGWRLCISA